MNTVTKLTIVGLPIVIVLLIIQGYALSYKPSNTYQLNIEITHNGVNSTLITTRCTVCHNAPVSKECIDCHLNIPVYLNNTYFPHHNITEPAGNITCSDSKCHNPHPLDVRYVSKPDPGHKYCNICHEIRHNRTS